MYKIKTYKKAPFFGSMTLRGFTEISGKYNNFPFYAESIGGNKWELVYNVNGYCIDDISSIKEIVTTEELFNFLKKCR